ncbi:MAG: glycosyltransferase family 4 protein [Candidatus Bathyarchaeia archaeon]
MKICVVTTWPPYREGIAIYSSKLYLEMSKNKKIKISIIANKIDQQSFYRDKSDLQVHRCWQRGPLALSQILKTAIKSEAHILHLQHGWLLYGGPFTALSFASLMLLLRLRLKTLVLTMHTIILRNAKFFKSKLLNCLTNIVIFTITKLMILFASRVIVLNTAMKKTLIQHYACKESKVVVIPHGVDKVEETFCQTNAPEKIDEINILSLGFLREDKGLEYLIDAFKKLQTSYPQVTLTLAGGVHPHNHDDYFNRIKNKIAELKSLNRIIVTNFLSESMLNEVIQKADIIILLSQETKYLEASGALARVIDFNKPVICTRIPKFMSELTHGYNCLMVNPHSSDEIYNAAEILLENVELRKNIATNLKKLFEGRSWSFVAQKHVELYKSLLKVS